MKITVMGKKSTVSVQGNPGTRICYIYNDSEYEGIAVNTICVPVRYKKPEDIIIGRTYEMTVFKKFAVRLTLISESSEGI